jgi:hypothetical protein
LFIVVLKGLIRLVLQYGLSVRYQRIFLIAFALVYDLFVVIVVLDGVGQIIWALLNRRLTRLHLGTARIYALHIDLFYIKQLINYK